MPIYTRRIFLVSAGASLVVLPFPALGDALNNPYRFALLPGATLNISVTFGSGNENAMSFWTQNGGGPENRWPDWPGCGNSLDEHQHPRQYQYTNNTQINMPFAFNEGYKLTPPNADQPWHFSPGVVLSYEPKAITIAYPNTDWGPTASNTNCQITVTVTDGVLPNGRSNAEDKKKKNGKKK